MTQLGSMGNWRLWAACPDTCSSRGGAARVTQGGWQVPMQGGDGGVGAHHPPSGECAS